LYKDCWRNCYTLPQFFCAQPKANKRRATGERERACAREERERAMLHNLLTALVLIPNLSRTSRGKSEPISELIYSGDPGPQSLPNLILSHRQGIREFGSGGGVCVQHQQNLGLSTRMRCLYGWMNHVRMYDYRPRCFHRCKLDQHHLQGWSVLGLWIRWPRLRGWTLSVVNDDTDHACNPKFAKKIIFFFGIGQFLRKKEEISFLFFFLIFF